MKQATVNVWDLPTRLWHWLTAIAIFYAWFSIDILENMDHHFWSGYTVLALILFRLIWGFCGSTYSRFKAFFKSIKDLSSYRKTLFKKDSTPYLGHNPIGSLAALTMMLCIAIQTLTGLFNTDDYFFGPLSGLVDSASRNWFGQIHDRNFDVLTILIGLHLIAILFYQFYKKQNLSQAMLTGRKPLTELSRHTIKKASLLLALIVILICIAVVYGLANCCQDSIPSGEIYF